LLENIMGIFRNLTTTSAIRLAKNLTVAILLLVPFGGSGAFAAPILASAARTDYFMSVSTTSVTVPLRNDGSKTLDFATSAANQTVAIVYHAECMVAAPRGTRLTIRVIVDGAEAEPSAGTDFALCSAVDANGQTWASAVRQSVFKVPAAGNHTVKISAKLVGGSGTWWLDDSSLVVQPALAANATREDAVTSTAIYPVPLPLAQNGDKVLSFATDGVNKRLKITYNAECVVAAAGKWLRVKMILDGSQYLSDYLLCSSVDSTGMTWAGAAHQLALTVPAVGTHTVEVHGQLSGDPGTWRVDDSSLVITKDVLATAAFEGPFNGSGATEVAVPIRPEGGIALQFTTTKDNQVVKLTYNAQCGVLAQRGRWLGLRVVVDGAEAAPASSFDFALCSSVAPSSWHNSSGFRQSVITIPKAGVHKVKVFARGSDAYMSWSLANSSLIVE
jgi:hypothetical protein